jgi:general secretion pathway protein B
VSYILDALRKAAEQRGAAGAVLLRPAYARPRPTASRAAWLLAGVALVLNAGSLIYLLRSAPAPAPPAAPVAAVRTPAPETPLPPPPPTRIIEPAPAHTIAATTPSVPPGVASAGRPRTARTTVPTPAAVTNVQPRPVPEAASTPPQVGWAKLKLEVLSYSDVAAERLVFINGHRYREGDVVEGGPRIEQIREDGVVLNDQGQRFTLR